MKGFTLIEIMVVMIIISVILSFATLSIGDGGTARQLEQEAQRLSSLLSVASNDAIMQAKEMGVSFETNGYRFYVQEAQQWEAAREDIFRPRSLPPGIVSEIYLEGEPLDLNQAPKNTPHLLILSSGEFTPFEVIFTAETNKTLRYRLTGTALGKMKITHDKYDKPY